MEKIIMLNQKMYLNYDEVLNYIKALENIKEEVIIFPSSLYLLEFINKGFTVGVQNICKNDNGAYTGEVSASQAKSIGAKYVLINHSELKEKWEDVLLKIKQARKYHLQVVLCTDVMLTENLPNDIIIAYEPVSSIGTGKLKPVDEIENIINEFKDKYQVKVLYGGSVNIENIEKLKQIKNLDGFLIGKSSVNPKEVVKMLEVVC